MDSFDVGALASEPLVVFCVATAGKGRDVIELFLDDLNTCFNEVE